MNRLLVSLIFAASLLPAVPDFSGQWRLVEQDTSAFRHRGSIGQVEGPVMITQSEGRLSVSVGTADPSGTFSYDLTGAVLAAQGPKGEEIETRSRWDGATLATKGRRVFTTPEGVFRSLVSRRGGGCRLTAGECSSKPQLKCGLRI